MVTFYDSAVLKLEDSLRLAQDTLPTRSPAPYYALTPTLSQKGEGEISVTSHPLFGLLN